MKDIKVIDGHIHYSLPTTPKMILDMLEMTETDMGNLVALYDKKRASGTIDCLYAKDVLKNKLYVYGANDITQYIKGGNMGEKLAEHVKDLMECGCDGIKMLEGKPTSRKRYPIPNFDIPEMDAYFDYLEKNNINVVWHVNDPEEFWDSEKCPDWAKRSGWFYNETFVNNEDQYNQIENVLKRHPKLTIIFAHFYFLSAQLDRLSALFDKYPNIGVDITPGIELFENLSKNKEKGREFFIKYQDRIFYGTDISGDESDSIPFAKDDSIIRAKLCRDFLSKKELFMKGNPDSLLGANDFTLQGLELDKEIVDKILYKNFYRLNKEPKNLNYKAILNEIEKERERIKFLSEYYKFDASFKYLDFLKDYFSNK